MSAYLCLYTCMCDQASEEICELSLYLTRRENKTVRPRFVFPIFHVIYL